MLNVSFYGVRGSTPCSCPWTARYGGNTSCVVVERPDEPPIVLDMGTGIRYVGKDQGAERFNGALLLSHMHWDHVMGLPFFVPLHNPESSIDIYGPPDGRASFGETFEQLMTPPFFPIGHEQLGGDVRFHDAWDDHFMVGNAKVRARPVPHTGDTNGYRIDWNGASLAYVSDHQQPVDKPKHVEQSVLELCDGVDLLIHDAQYTPAEFEQRSTWGHCTVEYAVEVARQAGARRLVMFHHDPDHGDAHVDALRNEAEDMAAGTCIEEVLAAAERWTVSLED